MRFIVALYGTPPTLPTPICKLLEKMSRREHAPHTWCTYKKRILETLERIQYPNRIHDLCRWKFRQEVVSSFMARSCTSPIRIEVTSPGTSMVCIIQISTVLTIYEEPTNSYNTNQHLFLKHSMLWKDGTSTARRTGCKCPKEKRFRCCMTTAMTERGGHFRYCHCKPVSVSRNQNKDRRFFGEYSLLWEPRWNTERKK